MLVMTPKKRWKIINGLLGKCSSPTNLSININGNITDDKFNVAESFSDHFINVPHNIDGLAHIPVNFSSMFFSICASHEVKSIVKNIRGTNAESDIAIKVIKLGIDYFSPLICKLFNLCLSSGVYPNLLKEAKVVPVFKSGSRVSILNYRPISILLNLNKIFEKIIYKRLNNYVEHYNILTDRQFGFRSGYSTETALLQLINDIVPAFAEEKIALGIFLDFSKAFDTIDHNLLLLKLEKYGVRGPPLKLIKSYLSDRKQRVDVTGILSQARDVTIGVPQGSCLGPLLFSLYSSDLVTYLNHQQNVLYADDTTIVTVSDELDYLSDVSNGLLRRVLDWSNYNKLSLNASKTKCILFTNRHILNPPVIEINAIPVDFVDSLCYLGVNIDKKLKFQPQIDHLESKLARLCGVSYRIGPFFDISTARSFYYAYCYPSLSYCLAAFGGFLLCSERGARLCNLQDRIVKNLFRAFCNFNTTVDELYYRFRLLKLPDIYRFKVASMMYRMIYCCFTPCIYASLDLQAINHNHHTRLTNEFRPPFPRVEAVRQSYKYQFVQIWNSVPHSIRTSDSVSSFNYKLIDYYLDNYK